MSESIRTCSSQSIYVVQNHREQSFFTMGQIYINILITVVAISRCILQCLSKYQKVGKYFINNIHLYHYKQSSQYAMKTHVLVHKLSHYYTVYLIFLVGSGVALCNFTPLYINISSGAFHINRPENVTFEQVVYFALPFDYTSNIRGYIPVFILNWQLSHLTASSFCIFDLFLSIMILHLWGHIRILINNLQSISKPQNNKLVYTNDENKDVFLKLRHCIRSHNLIIDFTDRMSNAYDAIIAIYYLYFQLVCCLLLLQCSTLELKAISRYGPLAVIMYQQLIQISIIFELLGHVSEKLPDTVYNVPWEYMNISNRKMVQILLLKSQKPIQFRALNMLNIGVQTMISILKSSVSYFIMLRTLENN